MSISLSVVSMSIVVTVVLGLCVFLYLAVMYDIFYIHRLKEIPNINSLWSKRPIVSIYFPANNNNFTCNAGDELVPFGTVGAVSAVEPGPCGCTENARAVIEKCHVQAEHYDLCKYSWPGLSTTHWRGQQMCVKRGGVLATKAEASYKELNSAQCPSGFKKCNTGVFPMTYAFCFSGDSICPITNMLIVRSNETVPTGQMWEFAGTFDDGATLYVHRSGVDESEQPIFDIVARLTEVVGNKTVRGECYRGPSQALDQVLVPNPSHTASKAVIFPRTCDIVDPRYHLFDSVNLDDLFLQQLRVSEPTCREHELYSLSDSRYQSALDPDYPNSGVKCGPDSHYVCVHERHQHIHYCDADVICNGTKKQNICGAYTRAVRSAFSEKSVQIGLFFARERNWRDACRHSIFYNHRIVCFVTIFFLLSLLTLGWLAVVLYCYFASVREWIVSFHCKIVMFLSIVTIWWVLQTCVFSCTSFRCIGSSIPRDASTLDCVDAYHEYLPKLMNKFLILALLVLVFVCTFDQYVIGATPNRSCTHCTFCMDLGRIAQFFCGQVPSTPFQTVDPEQHATNSGRWRRTATATSAGNSYNKPKSELTTIGVQVV